jgi:hypothetical protein
VGLTVSVADYYSDSDDSYQMPAEISYAGVVTDDPGSKPYQK